jgi:hypothetical protein
MRANTAAPERPGRYSTRLVVLEEPRVIEQVRQLALENGHSLGAEVRQALRYWLDANDRG